MGNVLPCVSVRTVGALIAIKALQLPTPRSSAFELCSRGTVQPMAAANVAAIAEAAFLRMTGEDPEARVIDSIGDCNSAGLQVLFDAEFPTIGVTSDMIEKVLSQLEMEATGTSTFQKEVFLEQKYNKRTKCEY